MTTIKLTVYAAAEAERLAITLGLHDAILNTRERMIAGHPTKTGHTQAFMRVRDKREFYLLIYVLNFTTPVETSWEALKAEHEHEFGHQLAEAMCMNYLEQAAETMGQGAASTEHVSTWVERPRNRLKQQ